MGLLMAFKLLLMAQQRWRRINAAHRIPLVWSRGPHRRCAGREAECRLRSGLTAGLGPARRRHSDLHSRVLISSSHGGRLKRNRRGPL